MAAMFTTSPSPSFPNNQSDTSWYMDSGATHHFTPEFGHLQNPTAYLGDAQVMVGNGKYIGISHGGNILLFAPIKPIHLKNVLHTPEISKQLISVTKLCVDNKDYIEFFSYSFSCEGSSVKEDSSLGQP